MTFFQAFAADKSLYFSRKKIFNSSIRFTMISSVRSGGMRNAKTWSKSRRKGSILLLKNSIRDAHTPQPGDIVFNTMTYRSETVQRLVYFQRSVTYIKVEIMFK